MLVLYSVGRKEAEGEARGVYSIQVVSLLCLANNPLCPSLEGTALSKSALSQASADSGETSRLSV